MGIFRFWAKKKKDKVDFDGLPVHIGIIMDGNGRWAKRRGVSRNIGHKAGADTFKRIVGDCRDIGIRYLTVYAFSTENWKRPKDEVEALCGLFHEFVVSARKDIGDEHTEVRFIGDISAFPQKLEKEFLEVQSRKVKDVRLTVSIAVNYGGRNEIVMAANKILKQAEDLKRPRGKEITEKELQNNLYTVDIPDPDLIIRPSGELRLSNFLIWQSAYSEFWFSDVLWPDFNKKHLMEAIRSYQSRDRRYGGI